MTPLARRRALLLAPLAVVSLGGAGLFALLRGMQRGEYNPRGVPSALIGQKVPDFELPALEEGGRGLGSADLTGLPGPVLVNFWASWCVPCIIEHPQLMRLRAGGLPIYGIAYKDKPEDSRAFLRRHGDPFRRVAADQPGRVAIDWGVYGVPESYLVDRQGIIRWRWAGPVTEDVVRHDLAPLLARHA